MRTGVGKKYVPGNKYGMIVSKTCGDEDLKSLAGGLHIDEIWSNAEEWKFGYDVFDLDFRVV